MTYEELLTEICAKNPRVVVMTAENRAAIRTIQTKIGPRFIDTGITEQTMVGMAAGMALLGQRPVIHALAAFLTMRAFEFIRTDIGIANLPVKVVGYIPGILSDGNGPTHQAIEDVALMRGIPGMNIFAPADIDDLLIGLPGIIAAEEPYYIRYNHLPSVVKHNTSFTPAQSEQFGEGTDVTLITYGTLFAQAFAAFELLKQRGYSAGLINLRTVKPIDRNAVLRACSNSALVLTVEDHFVTGGLYSILAELCTKHRIAPRIVPVAFEKKWYKPALFQRVLIHEQLTGAHIADKAEALLLTEKNNLNYTDYFAIPGIL